MKRNQTWLVCDILGYLSDIAQSCTRYNRDAVLDNLCGVNVKLHSSKLIVSNYADYQSSFALKIMQITPTCDLDDVALDIVLNKMVFDAIAIIAAGDSTFRYVNSAADGLKYTGLNSSYAHPMYAVACRIADASSGIGYPVTKIQYVASATFGNACVGMVFKCADSVYIIQFTD